MALPTVQRASRLPLWKLSPLPSEAEMKLLYKLTHDAASTIAGIAVAIGGAVATAILQGVDDNRHLAAWAILGVCAWYYKRGNKTPLFKPPGGDNA